MLSWGHVHLDSIIGADIVWNDSSDRIWKSGGRGQYRGQRHGELKECMCTSLKEGNKIDMYGNNESIYRNNSN